MKRIYITECDIERFEELLKYGEPFHWSVDGIQIEFVSREHRKEELKKQIEEIRQSMKHTGYGRKELRTLESLEREWEELE